MPPREFKEAYEKMKLGDRSVVYCHGSVGEKDEYFGISNRKGDFFQRGATLITRKMDGNVEVSMVPLGAAVSTRVRGEKQCNCKM